MEWLGWNWGEEGLGSGTEGGRGRAGREEREM